MPQKLTTEEIIKLVEELQDGKCPPSRARHVLEQAVAKIEELQEHIESANALWPSDPNGTRYESEAQAMACRGRELLNARVVDDRYLWIKTRLTAEQFGLLASGLGEAPHAQDSGGGSGNPPLPIKHALLLYLMGLKTAMTQKEMEMEFGVDHAALSAALPQMESALKRISPTARYVMKRLGGMSSVDQIKEIFPEFDGTVIADVVQVRASRPQDEQGAARGGKTAVYSTAIYTTSGGGILGISRTRRGAFRGIAAFDGCAYGMGVIGGSMLDPRTPAGKRLELVCDYGYRVIAGNCPGANVTAPEKTANWDMAPRRGAALGGRRAIVELVIGDIREYRIIQEPFAGTEEQFNEKLNVVTGLVNMRRMWPNLPPDIALTSQH